MKYRDYIVAAAMTAAIPLLGSCTGRTADNMTPTGETVEVVIPSADVAQDSAIAAGNTTGDTVVNE